MARAITSVPPPGGKGTMKLIGRSPGQAAPWPRAAKGRPARPAADQAAASVVRHGVPSGLAGA